MHPDEAPLVLRKLQDAAERGTTYASTHRLYHPDGTFRWMQGIGRVIAHDANGRASRMVGAVRDITSEVEARAKQRETEAFFADLVERVPGAIHRISVRPDGVIKHHYISPRGLAIWETEAETLIADIDLMRAMMSPEDALRLAEAFRSPKVPGAVLDMKVPVTTPSGKKKHLHIFGAPSARSGGVAIWTVLAFDITEQTRIEEELRKSREIILQTQKVEAIGALTGGMAHDFNNLLAIILGNLEFLQDDRTSPEAPDFIKNALEATLRGSQLTGSQLTRSLLSFARKAPLAPVAMNLNDVVRNLDSMLRRTLLETIALETVATGGLWQTKADRSSMESTIVNLVINARDAMPEGGKITIETANIRLTEDYVEDRDETVPPGRCVMLAITDTDTGIPPENISRIFEPFFTTKPVGKGTGLGLSLVIGFARQSGGTVQVYSEVGVGTTFKVYFKASVADEADLSPRTTALDVLFLRGKVLLVEDDAGVRKVMKSRLQIEGSEVFEAEHAAAAIAVFEAEVRFDMILTDIVMSGTLQGTHLVKKLRKRDPGLKAIFMSGYPNEANIHGNGLWDEDSKLMKPVGRHDLLKVLARTLGSGRQARSGPRIVLQNGPFRGLRVAKCRPCIIRAIKKRATEAALSQGTDKLGSRQARQNGLAASCAAWKGSSPISRSM